MQTIKEDCKILIGPVISKVRDTPLAARIILIPLIEHDWNKKQSQMSLSEKLSYLIRPSFEDNYVEYVKEIRDNTQRFLKQNECRSLFYHVSNITDSVLFGRPGNHDVLMSKDLKLRIHLFSDLESRATAGETVSRIEYREALDGIFTTYLLGRATAH